MTTPNDTPVYDVMVVGAGFAGMAAAVFATRRGLSVAMAGTTGSLDFSSGLIDLLGVHPVAKGRRWDDPWMAIRALRADEPRHPYARLDEDEFREAVAEFVGFFAEQQLPCTGLSGHNCRIVTPAGTIKRSYRVPLTMMNGVLALSDKRPTLLVDFTGLKGFSARQICETLGPAWPDLRHARVAFPGPAVEELQPEQMAFALQNPKLLEQLAEAIRPYLGGVSCVGLPAVLGMHAPMTVLEGLQDLLGLEVFELPTMPPSIAGARMRLAFERGAEQLGLALHAQQTVFRVEREEGAFVLHVGGNSPEIQVRARSVILATGRFFGRGLRSDKNTIREPLFRLPVSQPDNPEERHRERFFDPAGHPVNRAGLETDALFRPLGQDGRPAHERLFAVGAILAHQDWMREKCGGGLAIATAYKAVNALAGM